MSSDGEVRRRGPARFRRSRGRGRGRPVPRAGHRRARHSARTTPRGGPALLHPRWGQPDQRPEPGAARRSSWRAGRGGRRDRGGAGQPELAAVRPRRARRPGRPRGTAGCSRWPRPPTPATRAAASTARTSPWGSRRPGSTSRSASCRRSTTCRGSPAPSPSWCSTALPADLDLAADSTRLVFTTHSVPDRAACASGPSGNAYVDQHRWVAGEGRCRPAGGHRHRRSRGTSSSSRAAARRRCPGSSRTSTTPCAEFAAAGATDVVLVPIGFLSDHMEVIWDLDTQASQTAAELGIRLVRTPTVGTHPGFVDALAARIADRVAHRLAGSRTRPALLRRVLRQPAQRPPDRPRARPGATAVKLRLATRGSALAWTQSGPVADALRAQRPRGRAGPGHHARRRVRRPAGQPRRRRGVRRRGARSRGRRGCRPGRPLVQGPADRPGARTAVRCGAAARGCRGRAVRPRRAHAGRAAAARAGGHGLTATGGATPGATSGPDGGGDPGQCRDAAAPRR